MECYKVIDSFNIITNIQKIIKIIIIVGDSTLSPHYLLIEQVFYSSTLCSRSYSRLTGYICEPEEGCGHEQVMPSHIKAMLRLEGLPLEKVM